MSMSAKRDDCRSASPPNPVNALAVTPRTVKKAGHGALLPASFDLKTTSSDFVGIQSPPRYARSYATPSTSIVPGLSQP